MKRDGRSTTLVISILNFGNGSYRRESVGQVQLYPNIVLLCFVVIQEELLSEVFPGVCNGLKLVAALARKLAQESFFIVHGQSGDNDGTGRSQSI